METNFSKGNWVINQIERVECNGEIVALVYDGTASPTERENIDLVTANANLISAAPDMFNVLLELQESASYWSEYDVPIGIVERINSAIDKAVGSVSF